MITKPGTQAASGGGTGDVEGPASSTDNALARFDGTTGKLLQDTANATLSDEGYLAVAKLYSYNAFTNTSNYERFAVSWGSNLLTIGTEAAGTGTARDMEFNVGGSKLHIKTDGTIYLDAAGQTVGNARGAGAIELVTVRDAATQVASGAKAIAIGERCTSSGTGSVAIGWRNSATSSGAVCIGNNDNPSTASGIGSVVIGGATNVASGLGSAVISGYQSNTASGTESLVINGYISTASGRGSIASGISCLAANYAQFAKSSNAPVAGGAQLNLQPMYTSTTDATATVLNISNTATDRVVIPAKRACTVTGLITAYSDATDGYKVASWEIKCVIERNASNVTRIVGTPTITQLAADTDAAGWAVTSVTADDTNEALAITVTGEAATNIRWQGTLLYGQVGHA
jgi:hypothetical protein